MYTTTDERGIMNNYAVEPDMYYAVSPSSEQKRNYLFQGMIALALITSVVFMAVAVS